MRSATTRAIDGFSRVIRDGLERREHGMAELTVACFDESDKFRDSDVVAFSGCAFSLEGVGKFGEDWSAKLAENELPYLSMKDALRLEGPFLGWEGRIEERNEILRSFARLVSEVPRFSAPIPVVEFRRLIASQREKLWKDPQYCGFEVAVKGVLGSYPNNTLHMVCDLSEQYSEKCVTLYNNLRRNDPEVKARCVALTFADDKAYPSLQAAGYGSVLLATRRPARLNLRVPYH